MKSLFDQYPLGPITLKNRIVMAPLTRSRAGEGDVPHELNAEYYEQRASAGLIISEATQVSKQGQGYLFTPGIYTAPQVEGWKKVTDAVHRRGGKMFLQMWHVGRISHTTLQPEGKAPISSTDKPAQNSYIFAYDAAGKPGNLRPSTPRLATVKELQRVITDFSQAARNVQQAGFDGAEVHGANGYLFDQFLNSALNERTDDYGTQTKETRTRLTLEVFDAVADVLGGSRVGVRVAPYGSFNDMPRDSKVQETFLHLADEFRKRGAAYIHLVLKTQLDAAPVVSGQFLQKFRETFGGTILVTGGLTKDIAAQLLQQELADLFGFGALYIANPDLVERLANDWPLNYPDQTTFYGGAAKGYTDYPVYQAHT